MASAGGGAKRITKEFGEATNPPLPGIAVSLGEKSDLHEWNIIIDGPPQSPYAGGSFKLLLVLPAEYPFKPPKINFKTKIFHPNVSNDEHGSMCLGMLKGDQWKPSTKIVGVLEAALQLLSEPVPDDAVETGIAELFKNNRAEFDKQAKEWTRKYAK